MSRDRVVGAALLGIAIIYGLLGWDLPWVVRARPAAGFFPLLITLLLLLAALSMLIRPGAETVEMPTRPQLASLGRILGIVVFTVVVMPYTGFLVATVALLALVWLPADDPARRSVRVFLVIFIAGASYALFRLLLGVQLPKSVLGF